MGDDKLQIGHCWTNPDTGEFVCRATVDGGKAQIEATVAPMLDEASGRRSVQPGEVKSIGGKEPTSEGVDKLFNWMLSHTETGV